MKTILSWKRHQYVARVSIFLIMAALVVGMVGCGQPAPSYTLTISSTTGGNVITPGEGTFTYYAKGVIVLVVALVAEADEGYRFVNWTGDVGTTGNVSAASTNITVQGDYSITANFLAVYDLTISSTTGGNVTAPGEGIFTYDEGTEVDLVAAAEEGYSFVNWTGDIVDIDDVEDATTTITMNDNYAITANFAPYMVAAGGYHTVGLSSNGTAVAVGWNQYGQCNVGGWGNITQVAPAHSHTVGLKSDGTAVAVGANTFGQCDVGGWGNITQVAAGGYHTVGLKSDGTVVAMGRNDWGQCDVSGWSDIVQVAAGSQHTVGLCSNGTVVAVGRNTPYGQCNVGGWTGITQVAAGDTHTVGLKGDGTVVAVGYNGNGQCDVGSWGNITQVAAGYGHTVGLCSNSTVAAVGDNSSGQLNVDTWTDIIQVSAGALHTVGLSSNGTVVAVGWNNFGQCNVGGWTLK